MSEENLGKIIIYNSYDGNTKIEVKIENDTVWLTQQQMAELFNTSKQVVSYHIKNIYQEGELEPESTVKDFLTVQYEGERKVSRNVKYFNLDMIISLGYRIKSKIATHFRKWATDRLKEYLIKGFTMDDERLKGNAGGNYWKELLDRIRDIRSSEKVLYRQVLDLYATAIDYDPRDESSIKFPHLWHVVLFVLEGKYFVWCSPHIVHENDKRAKESEGIPTETVDFTPYKGKFNNINYTLHDTNGITYLGEDSIEKKLNNTLDQIKKRIDQKDPNNLIHCIWYCYNGTNIQPGDIEFIIKLLNIYSTYSIPLIFVHTRTTNKEISKLCKQGLENSLKKNNVEKEKIEDLLKNYVDVL